MKNQNKSVEERILDTLDRMINKLDEAIQSKKDLKERIVKLNEAQNNTLESISVDKDRK